MSGAWRRHAIPVRRPTRVVGVYPTASLRPLALAAGMTAVVLGVTLGSWMLIAGLAIVVSQVALLVRDADR